MGLLGTITLYASIASIIITVISGVMGARTNDPVLVRNAERATYATAAFEAYWSDDRDISREDVLADIATRAGIERPHFLAGIESEACKQRLRANTDELIERGGFGSPTMFVGQAMFFGNDRLPLVKAALERP